MLFAGGLSCALLAITQVPSWGWFGPGVLATPPKSGFDLVAWIFGEEFGATNAASRIGRDSGATCPMVSSA